MSVLNMLYVFIFSKFQMQTWDLIFIWYLLIERNIFYCYVIYILLILNLFLLHLFLFVDMI